MYHFSLTKEVRGPDLYRVVQNTMRMEYYNVIPCREALGLHCLTESEDDYF